MIFLAQHLVFHWEIKGCATLVTQKLMPESFHLQKIYSNGSNNYYNRRSGPIQN